MHPLKTIEEALVENLDAEGLLRLKAVDKTVELLKDKGNVTPDMVDKIFKSIYNSLNFLEQTK